jgi:hypothetical protein
MRYSVGNVQKEMLRILKKSDSHSVTADTLMYSLSSQNFTADSEEWNVASSLQEAVTLATKQLKNILSLRLE